MKIMLNILKIVCILMVLTFLQVRAQDGHYWTENYGNKSMLLSGTVNASVNDLGAVYYNPGRLGQIENPAFVINAKVYEWRTLKVEDGVDEGVDVVAGAENVDAVVVQVTGEVFGERNHELATVGVVQFQAYRGQPVYDL